MPPSTATSTDPDLTDINTLENVSQDKPSLGGSGGLIVGGTGYFDVSASSINLGNSYGILSVGNGNQGVNYAYLTPYIASAPGATINVTANTLEMPTSTIAALGGGDVNVTCTGELPASAQDPLNNSGVGVSMDLGSPDLADFEAAVMYDNNLGVGIYTTGGGMVNVTVLGTINIDTSRIATFSGGNINITSLTGDVNAGSGGTAVVPVNVFLPVADVPGYENVYANGIVADTLSPELPGAATQPGNITVTTPEEAFMPAWAASCRSRSAELSSPARMSPWMPAPPREPASLIMTANTLMSAWRPAPLWRPIGVQRPRRFMQATLSWAAPV